ncbi:MAG: DUF3943 domain-containing protein [Deltaproteobacteria bacterium]|nr:DUF3943 domain-containing protein [Deltaproteobacteria bacterium]
MLHRPFAAILSAALAGLMFFLGAAAYAAGAPGPAASAGLPGLAAPGSPAPSRARPGAGPAEPAPAAAPEAAPAAAWGAGEHKSYLAPAWEIPAFLLLLNAFDRLACPEELSPDRRTTYETNLATFWDHVVSGHWSVDHDDIFINQVAHPYQGSVHMGLARSAGLNFWESCLYANLGSYLWEMGGETTEPAVNDQINTGVGGSLLGETLFRLASLLLEGGGRQPGLWRELGAAVLSPSTAFNRWAYGERFSPVFPSHDPAVSWSLSLGASLYAYRNLTSGFREDNDLQPTAEFSLAYGLPGQPGYHYRRPFDYFSCELSGRGNYSNPFDLIIQGLLWGTDWRAGESFRGLWGLYGGYEYLSPDLYCVSSTSASLGTIWQGWLTPEVAFAGSLLGGIGYTAAGLDPRDEPREYGYGAAPQGRLSLGFIFGQRAMLELSGLAYQLHELGRHAPGSSALLGRLDLGLTVRLYGHHALGLSYRADLRNIQDPDPCLGSEVGGAINLVYTWLSDWGFGAVKWGKDGPR